MAYDKTEPIKNPSPHQSHGGMPGAPPPGQQPTTSARIVRFIAAAIPATVALSLGVAVIDAILPEAFKPSTLYGTMLARGHVAETRTQQDVVVDNTRRMAEATAAANAKWQMEIIAFQHQQQALNDAMQAKIALINGADATCGLGPIGIALFFGRDSSDARDAAQLVQAACTFAARTRQEVAAEQAQIARLNSAIMERQNAAGMH